MDEIEVKAEAESCPIATRDIAVNLKNRQNAIDNGGYGPLNPNQANNAFWKKKADRWDVTISDARKQICGNCAAFIKTPRMLDCIDKGLGNEKGNASWDVIEAGELGYCEAFDFKCASARTCDAWIVGGPITEEKGKKQETKSLNSTYSVEEKSAIEFFESLTDDEFTALFPNEFSDEANDVKWLFNVSYDFADSLINSRHAGNFGLSEKSDKLRDPKGGLTAAGRKYFKKKEGLNLKPGVKGPADTPEKMRRKGSFLVRFFTNPSGPMKDEKGRPTRLALSAAAWGEPVPQTVEAAAKLAAKGRRLLERYRKHKEAQKKDASFDDIELKAMQPTIGASGGRTIGQGGQPRAGKPIGGSRAASGGGSYNPSARDADGDGNVQEGTEFMRPASTRDSGSADTRERRAIREELKRRGFDGEAFKKLIDAEARKLKPGQKTNWNPGRLPNGGKIAADGTYIPPEMVREEDKRMRDYYRNRRGEQQGPNMPKPSKPSSGGSNEPQPSILPSGKKPRTGWLSPYFAGDYAHDEGE